ncbi:MAG: hypothetical protein IV092_04080 [Burkholderiaceae bacterium]|nr:hypothetical protein [Burkholderiaceae bacterium]
MLEMTRTTARVKARWLITALVALAELGHLAWQVFHGGIQRHHLLNQADLPAISNAWGAVFLPLLAWFLAGRLLRRATGPQAAKGLALAALGALVAGIALSLAFVSGNADAPAYILLGIILVGLVLPTYRSEYVLGFVLGMAVTFGPILPALVVSFIAAVSAMVHYLLRPAFGWALARVRA